MFDNYKCPVCGQRLSIDKNSYKCPSNHTFDVSKVGYVNFAIGKSDSGDNAQMCACRRSFLSKDYYLPFARLICDAVCKYSPHPDMVIDAGCGEGYYLRKLKEALCTAELFGVDLAKNAIRLAAKGEKASPDKKINYSVCGIFTLPFFDECADVVLSVFAPVAAEENFRVLKSGGYMLVAGPGKKHLSGLKSVLYDCPYENPEKLSSYDGFEYIETLSVSYQAEIFGEDITNLFTMTPYYWKTSPQDAEKLCGLSSLSTALEFEIAIYKKSPQA